MTHEISTQRASTGLALATFDDAYRFAQMVAKSEFAPKDFRGKPESCLLAIQHGSEIGLSPMQSLQNIACINGTSFVYAMDSEQQSVLATTIAYQTYQRTSKIIRLNAGATVKAYILQNSGATRTVNNASLKIARL